LWVSAEKKKRLTDKWVEAEGTKRKGKLGGKKLTATVQQQEKKKLNWPERRKSWSNGGLSREPGEHFPRKKSRGGDNEKKKWAAAGEKNTLEKQGNKDHQALQPPSGRRSMFHADRKRRTWGGRGTNNNKLD